MKINNIIPKEFSYFNRHNSLNKAKTEVQRTSEYLQMPAFAYRSNFTPNLSFGAIQKINKPKDFSDIEKFCEYFENKLQRDLGVKDEEDIINSIDKISTVTNSSKELATEVLTRVTQFGSYTQMANFADALESNGVNTINFNNTNRVDTSQALRYIGQSKGLLRNQNVFGNTNYVNIIDDFFLDELLDEDAPFNIRSYILHSVSNDNKLAIVDGWNIQIDGKNMGYSMIGATDNYEDISIAVINEMKKTGKNLDEVLNGDIITKTKAVLDKDVDISIIQNKNVQNPSVKTILDNINPKVPTKEEIQVLLETIGTFSAVTETKQFDPVLYKKLIENFAIYLDSYFTAYSPEKLNKVLKDKYNAIQRQVERLGKTMDDVYYFIPTPYKSFSMVTYQYAKVNNIPSSQIVQYSAVEAPPIDLKGKVGVILDDNLCSGDSLLTQEFQYGFSRMHRFYPENFNLIFSPIFSLRDGDIRVRENIERYTRKIDDKDFILSSKVLDFDRTMQDHFSNYSYRDELKTYLGALGYDFDNSAIMFPFNIPDNNSDFATAFSSLFFDNISQTNMLSKAYTGWNYPMSLEEIQREIDFRTGKSQQEGVF